MLRHTTLSIAALTACLAGCKASVGSSQPDNEWPAILDVYRDYEGTGGGQPGDRISPFTLPDQTASETDFRQFLGFVTVIDVGALWCVPCLEAAQTQQVFFEELQSDPVWILSVLVQDQSGGPPDPADGSAWAQQFGLQLPVLVDLFQEQQTDWDITTWPTALVIAPNGTVLTRYDGVTTEEQIAADVAQALQDHAADLREP